MLLFERELIAPAPQMLTGWCGWMLWSPIKSRFVSMSRIEQAFACK